jgi:hypothetical protein
VRSLEASRDATNYAREHRLPFFEALIAREAATIEAVNGHLEQGLATYDETLESLHRGGALSHLMATLANMVVFFDRFEHPEIAATLLGATSHQQATAGMAIDLQGTEDQLRSKLGDADLNRCISIGTEMEVEGAVR